MKSTILNVWFKKIIIAILTTHCNKTNAELLPEIGNKSSSIFSYTVLCCGKFKKGGRESSVFSCPGRSKMHTAK